MVKIGKKRRINAIQFNVAAIVLILVVIPFGVAFITNAGSSSDGNYSSSIEETASASSGYWVENGGRNLTSHYRSAFPSYPDYFIACAYIVEGQCVGEDTPNNPGGVQMYNSGAVNNFNLENPSLLTRQSHFLASDGSSYFGASGGSIFSWYFFNTTMNGIENNETIDKFKFSFVNTQTSYPCSYSEFTNISFNGEISFYYLGLKKTFNDFNFEMSNKYEYEAYDQQNGHVSNVCTVGLETIFDFTGFESLSLTEWNSGKWDETAISITFTDFEREDSRNFGTTPLPWAGDNYFSFSAEHQSTNSVQVKFVIQGLTLVLSIATFALAAASTPYWDPLRNFFKGALN